MNAVWVALIAGPATAALVTILNNRSRRNEAAAMDEQHRKDREEDRRRGEEAAIKVAEAARLLLASNERVAKSTSTTMTKLDEIHDLVNSDKTEGLKALRHALASTQWWQRHEAARLEGEGQTIPPELAKEMEDTEAALKEYDGVLAQREKTQAAIDAGKSR